MFADMPNTRKALERFAHNTALNARRSLAAKRNKVSIRATWQKEGDQWRPTSQTRKTYLGATDASGKLARSLTSRVTDHSVIFEMLDYGQWVDQGRKPSVKYPPPLKLQAWIRDKKVKVRDTKGRFKKMDKKTLAFLIGRKIKTFGIPATGFFSKVFLKAYDKLPDEIAEAILLDMDLIIDKK